MKNLHLLPTDNQYKGSISLTPDGRLSTNVLIGIPHHIYITSDEEIKVGDWFYDCDGELCKYTSDYTVDPNMWEDNKKIILTTDLDLIADGVQAIDDEFLEWFVKNPTCEFVEWSSEKIERSFDGENWKYKYGTVIPQEEPKQNALEEAAIENNKHNWKDTISAFIEGAKWQKEQDKNKYSEENMNEYADYCWRFSNDNRYKSPLSPKDWFEQFKK